MSPDLERLLNALWERDFGEPKDRARWRATAERLISDACSRQSGLSRDQFIDAIVPRYEQFRRARSKPSALPPKA
jgi:hypothetical protein